MTTSDSDHTGHRKRFSCYDAEAGHHILDGKAGHLKVNGAAMTSATMVLKMPRSIVAIRAVKKVGQ